ncbi:MAG: excisionase family DNA-binding protein [Acidimicrobiia bacterium]
MSESAQTTDTRIRAADARVEAAIQRIMTVILNELDLARVEFDKFYQVREAAEILGMPYRKLLQAIHDGDIGYIQFGSRSFRISGHSLVKFGELNGKIRTT